MKNKIKVKGSYPTIAQSKVGLQKQQLAVE